MTTKLGLIFICGNGHKQGLAFERNELRRSLAQPSGHDVWCAVCQRFFDPSPEWLEYVRHALEATGSHTIVDGEIERSA